MQNLSPDPHLVTLDGFHALKHAIRFGAEIVSAVATDPAAVAALAQELAPDVAAEIGALLVTGDGGHHPTGVRATAVRPAVDAVAMLAAPRPAPVVFLERPLHHGNVGAVIRVAAAAGAAGVLTSGSLEPWHPNAVRGSAGLHFALPVVGIEHAPATERPLVALDPTGEDLGKAGIPARAVLAFGSERHGLSAELRERADTVVAIPMRPGVSSLNLATAVAVVLYSFLEATEGQG